MFQNCVVIVLEIVQLRHVIFIYKFLYTETCDKCLRELVLFFRFIYFSSFFPLRRLRLPKKKIEGFVYDQRSHDPRPIGSNKKKENIPDTLPRPKSRTITWTNLSQVSFWPVHRWKTVSFLVVSLLSATNPLLSRVRSSTYPRRRLYVFRYLTVSFLFPLGQPFMYPGTTLEIITISDRYCVM